MCEVSIRDRPQEAVALAERVDLSALTAARKTMSGFGCASPAHRRGHRGERARSLPWAVRPALPVVRCRPCPTLSVAGRADSEVAQGAGQPGGSVAQGERETEGIGVPSSLPEAGKNGFSQAYGRRRLQKYPESVGRKHDDQTLPRILPGFLMVATGLALTGLLDLRGVSAQTKAPSASRGITKGDPKTPLSTKNHNEFQKRLKASYEGMTTQRRTRRWPNSRKVRAATARR
jgi:hypothetical protein